MRRAGGLALLLLAACADGPSVAHLTVDSHRGVDGIDGFAVTASWDGRTATTQIPLAAFVSIPPAHTMNLEFDATVTGMVTVRVEALGDWTAEDAPAGTTTFALAPSEVVDPPVVFLDGTPLDLSLPDLATPDLAAPDLATPDLATPDLARPDLSTPDLATPDLALPDLAMPDLAPCLADTKRDPRNCGACGASCATGMACVAGQCAWITEMWRAGDGVVSNVVVGPDDTAYFVDAPGGAWRLSAVDAAGNTRWTAPLATTGSPSRAWVALDDRATTVAVSASGVAYFRSDGTPLGTAATRAGALAVRATGDLFSGDSSTGTPGLADTTPAGRRAWTASFAADPADVAIGVDGTLFAHGGASGFAVAALSPTAGAIAWTSPTGGAAASGLAVTDHEVLSAEGGQLAVLELDGAVRFVQGFSGAPVCAPVIDGDGNIVFMLGTHPPQLVALRRTGAPAWSATLPAPSWSMPDTACHAPVVGADGVLYLTVGDAIHVYQGAKWLQSQPLFFPTAALDPNPLSSTGVLLDVQGDGRVHALATGAWGGLAATPWPSAAHDGRASRRAGTPTTGCPGVDVFTDAKNCGTCGHDCLGGACIAGQCQPALVTGGQSGVFWVAVDDTSVYFTTRSSSGCGDAGTVQRAPKTGGAATVLASGLQQPGGIVVDGTNVYWVDGCAGTVMSAPTGGGPPTTLAQGQQPNVGLAVDAGYVYFTNTGLGQVMRVAKPGGAALHVSDGQGPQIPAVDASDVYWADNGSTTASRAPVTGGAAAPVVTGLTRGCGVTLDDEAVYATDQNAGVYAAPKAGGPSVMLAADTSGICLLTVDGTRVYWDSLNTPPSVRAAPLGGGPTTVLASGFSFRQGQDAAALYLVDAARTGVYLLAR